MTKEITKAYILQQLQDKFKLRELEPEIFALSELVTLTYDVGQHLTSHIRKETTLTINSSGAKQFWEAPEDERWFIHRYNVIFVTGVFTIAGVFIGRPSPANYIYLDLTAAQNTSYAKNMPVPVVIEPGDMVYVNVDGYTSSGNLTVIMDVIVEEIR